jgi:hypothetical protein
MTDDFGVETDEIGNRPATANVEPFAYRIFGLGMNKTGTSSLERALRQLGVGPIATQELVNRTALIDSLFDHKNYEPALRFAAPYRVFEDRPWNVWDMYSRLDERYPGSRFILTRRDPGSWWRSVHRWITVTKPHMSALYQRHLEAVSLGERDMIDAYERFNRNIVDYFAGRDDFVELNFEAGHGWPELCNFLDLPVPATNFPHTNRQTYTTQDATLISRGKKKEATPGARDKGEMNLLVDHCTQCGGSLDKVRKRRPRKRLAKLNASVRSTYYRLRRKRFMPTANRYAEPPLIDLRAEYPELSLDDMAVVTCFFNPTASRAREENYRRFRSALEPCGLPVLTVELAFGDDPFMLENHSEELIQLRSPDRMWQKECLLNLGIQRLLDRGFKKIVWLDADIVFEQQKDWPWYVAAALENAPVCQVFNRVIVEDVPGRASTPGISGVDYFNKIGNWVDLGRHRESRKHPFGVPNGYPGFGWAATAEVLSRVRLYDRAIVGGADRLMLAASCPRNPDWEDRITEIRQGSLASCHTCGHVNESPGYTEDFLA